MTVENPEGFTEEEQQALDSMQSDDGLEVEDVVAEEPEIEEVSEGVKPVAVEEPKEEPQPEAKTDDARPPEGFVPHGALHAEREKRKALEDRLAKLEEAGKPKEEVPQPADPVFDPEGFRRWQEHQLAQPVKALEQFQQQQQEQARHQQMMQDVTTHEAKFRETTPDYDEAAQFMLQARVSELRGAGYGEPEIQKQVQQDITQLYTAATTAGLNPAQLAYLRAGEMGYKKAAPAPVQADVAQKMEATANAQRQTQGAQSSGGGGGEITMATLANMSEAELAKIPEDVLERVMGG